MRRIDTDEQERHWKIALAGPGGTGKTSMGVSAPKPLILLSERQGMPSVRMAAKRLGVPVPPVALVEEAADYRQVLRALRGPRDKPFTVRGASQSGQLGQVIMQLPVDEWPETVVLDSLTDACDVLIRDIRNTSPQRKGRDGLPVDAQRFWGVLIDRAVALIKEFRDLPMHVVFLCLLDDRTKEDEDGNLIERIVQPKLATKNMAQQLSAAVNVLAYTYRTWRQPTEAEFAEQKSLGARKPVQVPVYGVATIGNEGWLIKPCEPLRPREVPNLTSWINRLNGNLEDVPEMPLPLESQESAIDPSSSSTGDTSPGAGSDASGDMSPGAAGDTSAGDEGDTSPGPGGDADQEAEPDPTCSHCRKVVVQLEGDICPDCEADIFDKAEKSQEQAEPDPEPKLTPGQKAARTRARNKAKAAAAAGGQS